MFDADICLGIRFRETAQGVILSADPLALWNCVRSKLVCCETDNELNRLMLLETLQYHIKRGNINQNTCQSPEYPSLTKNIPFAKWRKT